MLVLLNLLSGVALLTYGIYLVKSGVLRVFGSNLNALVAKTLQSKFWPHFSQKEFYRSPQP